MDQYLTRSSLVGVIGFRMTRQLISFLMSYDLALVYCFSDFAADE